MGLLSVLSKDIEELVRQGFSDKEISLMLDVDLSIIKLILVYFRDKLKSEAISQ